VGIAEVPFHAQAVDLVETDAVGAWAMGVGFES
jgi:hypothetical protein